MDLLTSREALSNALSGAAADAFSTVVLFPLDKIKILMQADSTLSIKEALEKVLENPVHGVESKLISSVQQKFQYFYVYILLKEFYKRRSGKPGVLADLFIGYVSALQGLITTLPLEVTSTRIITDAKADGKNHSFWATFMHQYETEGMASFYKTVGASAVLCLNPAITYVIFEELKVRILANRKISSDVLSTLEALVVGIIAKSVATVLTFPFIRTKVLMSVWKKKHPDGDEGPSLLETMQLVHQTEGFGGLFKGLEPQLFKGVTNAALMLAVKENIYTMVKKIVMV